MKPLKIVISLFLVLSLLCVLFPTALAEQAECETTPVIMVNGVSAIKLYGAPGTPFEGQDIMEIPGTDQIMSDVKEALPTLLLTLGLQRYKCLGQEVSKLVMPYVDKFSCDADGNSKYEVISSSFPLSYAEYHNGEMDNVGNGFNRGLIAEGIGADHVYNFVSDWRLDVMEHGRRLHDFIENVKQRSGHDKVSLVGVSQGGAFVLAYLQQFGHGSVENLVLLSSTHNGVELIGDLYSGRVAQNPDTIAPYLVELLNGNPELQLQLRFLLLFLRVFRVLDVAFSALNYISCRLKPYTNPELLVPAVAQMPGIWSMVPPDDYEYARDYLLDKTKHAKLIEKIDAYYYDVQTQADRILDEAMADGMRLFITSHYGMTAIPFGENATRVNDGLADTYSTSLGATCAPIFQTFPSGYTQKNDDGHSHLSADGIIDASTVKYPEQTWFFKGLSHVDYGLASNAMPMIIWMITAKEQYTVHSRSDYAQFMAFNAQTRLIEPLR